MPLEFKLKAFNELTRDELYTLLRLRSEVFVVEQNCVYQDIDNKDQKALHVLGYFEDELVAYTRLFAPGDYFELASIGRVIIKESYRNRKWGLLLMKESIRQLEFHYKVNTIKISAQCYLENFYESLGFKGFGKQYLEDGIPHLEMIRTKN